MPSRRRWLQVGLLGGALLSVAGVLGSAACSNRSATDSVADAPADIPQPWSGEAASLIAALAPVILGPACSQPAACSRVVEGVRQAVAALSPAAQRDIGELFMLLNIGPARGLLTGVWADWSAASQADLAAFLDRWRHSRMALLQAGYHALHDLILAAWYAEPESWDAIGYPGPPNLGAAR